MSKKRTKISKSNLDIKDLRILKELDHNARQSYSEIGRKVGLSKEVVLYRIHNMEKTGVIKGYLTHIDLYKFGFRLYPVLFKFEEINKEEENELINYCKSSKQIVWIAKCEGRWDLNIHLSVRNAGELVLFFDEFERRYGQFIHEKVFMYTASFDYFKRNFGIEKEERERIHCEELPNERKLSQKEEMLLNILATNAKMPITELSSKISSSPPTVMVMIKKLEQEKVIRGYTVFSEFKSRNQLYYKIFFNLKGMTKEKWKKISSFISFDPHILWSARIIGYYDFSIELEVPDADTMRAFVSTMKERFKDQIKRHDVLLVHDEVSMRYIK